MNTFQGELQEWGPEALADRSRPPSVDEARNYCRQLARGHYENFSVVSWLLPKHLHQHFYNVYAYCRWADDLGDEIDDADRSLELLGWWRSHLQQCHAGEAQHPVFVALHTTIQEFAIPINPFGDLISAFEQDQRIIEYATFEQLLGYCRCSADPVGRIVLYLCRQNRPETFEWSDSICTGLQLANFWQDVARDLDIGRIYLPEEDRLRFGYSREDLDARVTNDAFLELMRFQVERARTFFDTRRQLVECLPFRLQVDIDLFGEGGLKILDRIERIGFRVWETRPVVTKADAFSMLIGSLCRAVLRRVGLK